VGERVRPQAGRSGREAHPTSATLATVTTSEHRARWCGRLDPPAFARWLADRAVGAGPHLVPVTRVGRCPQGHLAAEVLHPAARVLDEALDVIGVPTEGVAVTLTVPLLELAGRARAGAIELGLVPADGVTVDESGAVVVADRPPGASPPCAAASEDDVGDPEAGRPPTVWERDGPRQLLTAARSVWDRVDARSPARSTLDSAFDAARDGDARAVADLLELVAAAAPPRPVRWSRPVPTLFDEAPSEAAPTAAPDRTRSVTDDRVERILHLVQDVVERGVPVGPVGRLPVRHVLVGAVVTAGLVTAAVNLL